MQVRLREVIKAGTALAIVAHVALKGSPLQAAGSQTSSIVPKANPGTTLTEQVVRLPHNPIISPNSDPTSAIGTNINGPSLIRVPSWVEHPLGSYYLYFADHNGKYIRLAYANHITGPWKIYGPGALTLNDSFFTNHIASPDAIIDADNHTIRLYYHGLTPEDKFQSTRVAVSQDGVHFAAREEPVGRGSAYWRVFRYGGYWYALAMPGKLYRSRDGISAFEPGPQLFEPSQVHNAVKLDGDVLTVYYTRSGDRPEHIVRSIVNLGSDWTRWKPSAPEDVLSPETEFEGADLPLTAGSIGALNHRERALRDPAIFRESGKSYLLYAIAGESGIAIAELVQKSVGERQ